MNQHAVEMMAGRVQGKELVVESMRQPSQGMPIKSVGRGKGPPDGAPGQTTLDVEIAGDVIAIVEDDKRVPNDGAVEGYGHGCEQKAEDGLQLGAGEEWPASRRRFWCAAFSGWQRVFSRDFGRGSFVHADCTQPAKAVSLLPSTLYIDTDQSYFSADSRRRQSHFSIMSLSHERSDFSR